MQLEVFCSKKQREGARARRVVYVADVVLMTRARAHRVIYLRHRSLRRSHSRSSFSATSFSLTNRTLVVSTFFSDDNIFFALDNMIGSKDKLVCVYLHIIA